MYIFIFIITQMYLFVLPNHELIWQKPTKLMMSIAVNCTLNQRYRPRIYREKLIAEVIVKEKVPAAWHNLSFITTLLLPEVTGFTDELIQITFVQQLIISSCATSFHLNYLLAHSVLLLKRV